MTLLEVCVDSVEGALAAARIGAQRIELCSRLDLDGLSPPLADLEFLLSEIEVPIHPMVRPRAGDFVVTPTELETMEREVQAFASAGAHGLVFGCLRADHEIDVAATTHLLRAANGLPVTFHRAFDGVPDQEQALEVLIELGVTRVLTSGGAPTAWEGCARLRALVGQAGARIGILAGGGVREHNARALIEATGAREIHGSVAFSPEFLGR